jgi:hypothetical protein
MAELNENTGDMRLAINATASIDAFGARIYWWAVNHEPPLIGPFAGDDDGYRKHLAPLNADYHLLCDVARAFKHINLRTKTPRLVYSAAAVSPQALMVSEMETFSRDWTTKSCVLIQREDGLSLIARNVLERALGFLEGHMDELVAP